MDCIIAQVLGLYLGNLIFREDKRFEMLKVKKFTPTKTSNLRFFDWNIYVEKSSTGFFLWCFCYAFFLDKNSPLVHLV